jgi:hypothetical protein
VSTQRLLSTVTIVSILLFSSVAGAQTPTDQGPFKLQNVELGTCLGVREDHGKPYWGLILVKCTDELYTEWKFESNDTIKNVDLGTCVGIWNYQDNPEVPKPFAPVLVPCNHSHYTKWDDIRDPSGVTNGVQLRDKDTGRCIGYARADGIVHWPTKMYDCSSATKVLWRLTK